MVVYAPARIISAPAKLITAPAQLPAKWAVVYTALFLLSFVKDSKKIALKKKRI